MALLQWLLDESLQPEHEKPMIAAVRFVENGVALKMEGSLSEDTVSGE